MGRKLEFSKETALLQAMEGFWAQGYEATSMRDLAQRLNLHLGSVYNALGDKDQVFESALRLHLDHTIAPKLARLATTTDPRAALEEFIGCIVDECRENSAAPGCFFINSLLRINRINDRISAAVHDYLQMCELAIAACIARAQARGQVCAEEDPKRLARFTIACCKSMYVMKKIGANDDFISDIQSNIDQRLFCKKA